MIGCEMETIAQDFILLLQYLLPGFLTAWIFYAFTSYSKPSQFERIIEALIFTILVQAMVLMTKSVLLCLGEYKSLGSWNSEYDFVLSLFLSIVLGLMFSYFANTDQFHKAVRFFKISHETSYPSEWFGLFSKEVTYIVLHLKDERRIYGWPIEWSSSSKEGHIVLQQAAWLIDNEGVVDIHELEGVSHIMIDTSDVMWVEFMKKTWDEDDEQENS